MKKFVVVLLGSAMAFAIVPSALADPIRGSVAVAGIDDASFNSTSVAFAKGGSTGGSLSGVQGSMKLDGLNYANAKGVGSPISFTIEGPIEESIVNGVLNVSGSKLMTESGRSLSMGGFGLNFTSAHKHGGAEIISVAAPEPSSLLLLGTGFLGLALVAFWKGKSSRPVGNR